MTMPTHAGDVHRLATRVAKASRLANAPISYYQAHADIRVLLTTHALQDLPAYFSAAYGPDAWNASAPGAAIQAEDQSTTPA
jgi:hypothetical protein